MDANYAYELAGAHGVPGGGKARGQSPWDGNELCFLGCATLLTPHPAFLASLHLLVF